MMQTLRGGNVGTRSEIYVRNHEVTIELWKHWDGYPEYMVPYFKEFAKFARRTFRHAPHRLTYPEDVSALLIAFDYITCRKMYMEMRKQYRDTHRFFSICSDIRPRGRIDDFQMIWILDLPNTNESGVWRLIGYDTWDTDFLPPSDAGDLKHIYKGRVKMTTEEMRKMIHERKQLPMKPVVEETILRVRFPKMF
jgi:hypothetical protein